MLAPCSCPCPLAHPARRGICLGVPAHHGHGAPLCGSCAAQVDVMAGHGAYPGPRAPVAETTVALAAWLRASDEPWPGFEDYTGLLAHGLAGAAALWLEDLLVGGLGRTGEAGRWAGRPVFLVQVGRHVALRQHGAGGAALFRRGEVVLAVPPDPGEPVGPRPAVRAFSVLRAVPHLLGRDRYAEVPAVQEALS